MKNILTILSLLISSSSISQVVVKVPGQDISGKLNKTDSAAMLSPYLRKTDATNTYQHIENQRLSTTNDVHFNSITSTDGTDSTQITSNHVQVFEAGGFSALSNNGTGGLLTLQNRNGFHAELSTNGLTTTQLLNFPNAPNGQVGNVIPVSVNNVFADANGNITLTVPSQVNADWNASSGVAQILNKPTTLSGYGITDAVPISRTVNGHALSSNVVVSASDLTTGTLPHAQLPTLLSTDIPNIAESQVTNLTSDLAAKQATLVSGTNIKTINGVSILGSGDIPVSGGGGYTLPPLTNGSVLFYNGTDISQDNGNLFWDNTNKRLGIGLTNPAFSLGVQKNQNAHTAITVANTTGGTNSQAAIYFTSDGGVNAGQVFKYSSLTTAYKSLSANDFGFYNYISGNISILNDYTSGNINLTAGGGSVSQFTVNPNGNIAVLNLKTGSTAPTTSGTVKLLISDANGTLSNVTGTGFVKSSGTAITFDNTAYQPTLTKGTATLIAGTVTVSTSAITASSKIFLSVNTPSGTQGFISAPAASIVAGTSFVINSSSASDTSTINWFIL